MRLPPFSQLVQHMFPVAARRRRGRNHSSLVPRTVEVLESRVVLAAVNVVSFTPVGATTTSAPSVAYTLTFDQSVSGVDGSDFTINRTGGATSDPAVVVAGSGATYTVSVFNVTGTGTIGLTLVDDGSIKNVGNEGLQPNAAIAAFNPMTSFASSGAFSLATGVFDTGATRDLVILDQLNNTARVYLGAGDGTFTFLTALNVGATPTQAVTSDLNGDGFSDIAVANSFGTTVTVYLTTGSGTFDTGTDYTVGDGPTSLAIGSVNGDGFLDLVTANYDGTYSVLLGAAGGTFGAATTSDAGPGTVPIGIAIGNFAGDANADLSIINQAANSVRIFAGNGTGTFDFAVELLTGDLPVGGTLGDFDGDMLPDGVVSSRTDKTLTVYLGTGATTTISLGKVAESVAAADINGDGDQDLVIVSSDDNSIGVLLGNGDGTFKALQTFATGSGARSLVVDDFNGDGRADVITANFVAESASVLLGKAADFPATPFTLVTAAVNLSISAATVSEGGTLTLTATIPTITGTAVTVNVNYTGSAVLGTDFTASAMQIVIPTGTTSASITLTASQVAQLVGDRTLVATLGTIVGARAGAMTAATATIKSNSPSLDGPWSINGQPTSIVQAGNNLTFTNEFGMTATGRIISKTQIVSDTWGITGTLVGTGQINWSNNTVWTRSVPFTPPTLPANWMINGQATTIAQNGLNLTFTNEFGDSSTGRFTSTTDIVATKWGITGKLNGQTINWSNSTTWTTSAAVQPGGNLPLPPAPVPMGSVGGFYTFNGLLTSVQQDGQTLTLINESGDTSAGILNAAGTVITATKWGITGQVTAAMISWSNNTTWTKSNFVAPTLSTGWTIGSSTNAMITPQNGRLLLTNEFGGTSSGQFQSPTQILAINWGIVGTLSANNSIINWSNSTKWTANGA